MKVLYINGDASKPQCSVYEAGLNYYEAIANHCSWDVLYIDFPNTAPSGYNGGPIMEISLADPDEFDLTIYNYAYGPMSNMPYEYIKRGKSLALTNDMYYESPWGFMCIAFSEKGTVTQADKVFDFVGVPDPTLTNIDDRTCVLPRCCPRFDAKSMNNDIPIISTYGFPSPEKQLDLVTKIVSEEFDKAILRMHFPQASHQGWDMQGWIRQVFDNCCSLANSGIKMEFSNDYKSRSDLIAWLSESSLNVFLHNPERFFITKGAIPASIDLAISAQQPIAFSDSMENRHIMSYQLPYPSQSFRESIENGNEAVLSMYEDWSPQQFAKILQQFVEERL